ncbi:MAG: GUN4 domain-containing protein [Cyanophyceae cyanobacterium]
MVQLLQCVECGNSVSDSAENCPHCQAQDYRGLTCTVCLQPVKPSEVRMEKGPMDTAMFFHPECFSQVRNAPRPCGSCGVFVVDASIKECPNCGNDLDRRLCSFCNQPFSFHIEDYDDRIEEVVVGGVTIYKDVVLKGQGHRVCAEARGGKPRETLYEPLFNALEAGQWREADRATDQLVRYFASNSSVANFPVAELKQIDELWVKYSQGKFGFSVQSRLWREAGGTVGVDEPRVYGEFALRVGWQRAVGTVPVVDQSPGSWKEQVAAFFNRMRGPKTETVYEAIAYQDLIFDLSAPPGHLPFPGANAGRNFSLGRSRMYTDSWDVPYMAALASQLS